MPCCLGIFAVGFPRLALIIMWLTGYAARGFESRMWPILGFFFMPFTTCAYVFAMNEFDGVKGIGLFLVIAGALLDFGGHGASARSGGQAIRKRRGSW